MKKLICWWRGYHAWERSSVWSAWVVGGKVRKRCDELVKCTMCGQSYK